MKEIDFRKPTVFIAYLPIIFMLAVILVGHIIIGININVVLLLCIAFNMMVAKYCNISIKQMLDAINKEIGSMGSFLLVLVGIGFLIGSFLVSGTIPVLIVWMSKLIVPKYALILCLLMTSILAFSIGSSFASLGTIGLVMFSVATLQGVNPSIAAAAVICGANVGEYISPVSALTSLASTSNRITYFEYAKSFILPFGISYAITAVLYLILGQGVSSSGNVENVQLAVKAISENFSMNPIAILPIIVAIIFAVKKMNSLIVLYGSSFVALILGVVIQGFPIVDVANAGFGGFSTEVFFKGVELPTIVSSLLNRGGIVSMQNTVVFLVLILTAVSLLKEIGVFEVIKETVFKNVKSGGSLALVTTLFGMLFGIVTCEPYATVVVTSEVARAPYENAGFDSKKIAPISIGCAQLTAYLTPWSVLALYFASVLGVSPLEFAPYAFLYFLIPVVILILSYLGIGNPKLQVKNGEIDS